MYAGAPKSHINYFSGAIIWGSVHPTEDNILLLNDIDMYNYTAVRDTKAIFLEILISYNIVKHKRVAPP